MFGGNDTKVLARKIRNYNFEGLDAILSSSPHYSKPTQEGVFQHYMHIAKASPIPVIIYNVPGRTSCNVSAETTLRLANASSKFIAVKEASGNLVQAMHILKNKPKDFMVLSGDDPTALPLIACGGEGVISVIGNAYPRIFSDMIRAALKGKFKKAKALNDSLLDIHDWLYVDGNPVGIKAALEIMKICQHDVRLPLTPMQKANYRQLKKVMKALESV